LRNSYDLLPEIDFVEQAIGLAKALLQAKSFLLGQDFSFDPDGQITLTDKAKAGLFVGTSVGDRLLLEKALHIHD
jgi:hypothetical protein